MSGVWIAIVIAIILFAGLGVILFGWNKKKKNSEPEQQLDMYEDIETSNPDLSAEETIHTEISLADVNEIILRNDNLDELIFQRPDLFNETKKYQEVLAEGTRAGGHAVQAALPALGKVQTITEIKKVAPNGLYTTTVDKAVLSRFKDGTFTTMVRDADKNLVGHAGFKEIGQLQKTNPVIALNVGMQAMAAISGQYYMTQINDQLMDISQNIEELINMHHDEKIGLLQNAHNRLDEITRRVIVEREDLKEIREIRAKIGDVYQEYWTRFKREYTEIKEYRSNNLLVEKRVANYLKKIERMNFTLRICVEAEKLSMQAEATEVAVRMKLNINDPILPELYTQIQSNYDSSLLKRIKEKAETIYQPIIDQGEKIVSTGKNFGFIDKNKDKQMSLIAEKSKETISFYEFIKEKELMDRMLAEREKEYEILLMIDDSGKQKVYIPAET